MKNLIIVIIIAAFALTGCKNTAKDVTSDADIDVEQVVSEESDWITLFNGENLEGWHAYNNGPASDQWQVEDGVLVLSPAETRESTENLVTDEEFTSFKLSLEWKISEGGNSGVMWAVAENPEYPEPYYTGPEIQILDNERHPDAKAGKTHQAGALYDMVAPSKDVVNPAGQWNLFEITIDHHINQGTVLLNGTKVVDFPVSGPEWEAMIADSKFADWQAFGKNKSGHIALQDHGDKVWFRNIKIKKL